MYLIVFKLTDFDVDHVRYWMQSLRSNARLAPVLLVGTHVDDERASSEYLISCVVCV